MSRFNLLMAAMFSLALTACSEIGGFPTAKHSGSFPGAEGTELVAGAGFANQKAKAIDVSFRDGDVLSMQCASPDSSGSTIDLVAEVAHKLGEYSYSLNEISDSYGLPITATLESVSPVVMRLEIVSDADGSRSALVCWNVKRN